MVDIVFTKGFITAFRKVVKKAPILERRVLKRIDLFADNPFHNSLHSHTLSGKMRKFLSFSITCNIRIIYYWENGKAILVTIGTHDDIYK